MGEDPTRNIQFIYQQGELAGKFDMLKTEVRATLVLQDKRLTQLESSVTKQSVFVGIVMAIIFTTGKTLLSHIGFHWGGK